MSSGATDQYSESMQGCTIPQSQQSSIALDLNRKAFNFILFRPRVLVDVEIADTRTQMMGQDTSLPVR